MKSLKTNFWVDVLIFGGFLAALQPRLTGIAVHEWLNLAAVATLILHVVLHWDWVVGVTRTLFHNLLHVSRLNYLVDALVFLAFTVTVTSGLVISKVVAPTPGLQVLSSHAWNGIHSTASNATLLLVALHFALHWSWVRETCQRLLVAPFKQDLPARSPSTPTPANRIKAI
jgi:hypothetical protein